MKKIHSILIANRGEIAIRIIKTARKMGIKTYCFQTLQEANAIYLNWADEIITLPEENNTSSIFLDAKAIVNYASELEIDAIHPGYGFLSENPLLAQLCKKSEILFIGPDSNNIIEMGDKNRARILASKVGIPVVKGSDKPVISLIEATIEIKKIGYPVILKALAGGGGKGMRIVRKSEELEMAYKMAVSEAQNAFANSAMIIEKYIENPKHIEVQILADKHGNAVHLYERECSIQRNHQKLLEEAPSKTLTKEIRQKITNDALRLTLSTNYSTLGTVEFLLENNNSYYFMEMNTRIQVEHPVTEAITGIDLVEWQIRTATGEKLAFTQNEIKCKGAAIEFRINAEDVQAGFTPNFGIIDKMYFPSSTKLRVDSGFEPGSVIPNSFDSLVAKLIVWGDNRESVIKKSRHIIEHSKIEGIKTTLPFFKAVLKHPDFIQSNFTTSFVENMDNHIHQVDKEEEAAAMIALQSYLNDIKKIKHGLTKSAPATPWTARMWNKLF